MWFWRERCLNIVNEFSLFAFISPWNISRPIIYTWNYFFFKEKMGHVLLKLTEWLKKGSFYKLSMFCLLYCFLWVFHFFWGGGDFFFCFFYLAILLCIFVIYCYYLQAILSPWKSVWSFCLIKDGLCQVWLKLTQLFWRIIWKCEKIEDRQTEYRWSEKSTWVFSSDELRSNWFHAENDTLKGKTTILKSLLKY